MDYTGVNLKTKVVLENEAHFEDCFQIYPSMLEKSTGEVTILTLVSSRNDFEFLVLVF